MKRSLAESLQQTTWSFRDSPCPEWPSESHRDLVRALAMLLLNAVGKLSHQRGGADERETQG